MNRLPHLPGGVWLVDFEFRPAHGHGGNPCVPVCMVANELHTGQTLRLWLDTQQFPLPCPFPTDGSAMVVAYYASSEIGCFQALGWSTPVNLLDLYAEFRCHTNGRVLPCGNGLLGALTFFGLPSMLADEKESMRALVLRGGPWSPEEQPAILDYCEQDVVALRRLLPAMAPHIDWPRALLRGRYTAAVAAMERRGIPLDMTRYHRLMDGWSQIKDQLVAEVDQHYQVFENGSFKVARFNDYLRRHQLNWPRLPSRQPDLSDTCFGDMARVYPQLLPLRQLRQSLAQLRHSDWQIGEDGRSRCLLSMFSAKTGRNQPSTSKFVFGAAAWRRSLIQPKLGCGLAYVDWSQQEFGIAAALSKDAKMIEGYESGDPYLTFAKQAGAVPPEATRESHEHERGLYKQCMLAVQYGMGAESLALRIRQPIAYAKKLLARHRQTYSTFWQWSDGVLDAALLGKKLWTTFGWQLHVAGKTNARSLRNFPVQANGAEMLRLACIRLHEEGIHLCAPIHDAVLIEAPLDELDEAIRKTQQIMRWASATVLDGFCLNSDVQVIRYPEHFVDARGTVMWDHVLPLLDQLDAEAATPEGAVFNNLDEEACDETAC